MEKRRTDIPELHQKKNVLGKLSEMFIDRYRTVYLILMALFIVGWMSYTDLPRENIPEVESNMVRVMTTYAGASPEDIVEMITDPIEDAISGLDDLTGYTSTSAAGYSSLRLEYEFGIDMDEAIDELQDKIDGVDLPEDANDPSVMHMKTSEIPILSMSVTGNYDLATISSYAEDLESKFDAVDGVDSVNISGETEALVTVVIDPAQLEAYGITINDISAALSGANIALPAGDAELDGSKYNIRVDEEFENVAQIRDVLISAGGSVVRLGDVADVNMENDEGDIISRTYRKEKGASTMPVVYMSVYRDNGADTIAPVHEILSIIEDGKGSLYPDDMEIIITSNFAEDVEDSLGTVIDSAISGLLVVVLVLFLFIDLREALIVSLVIPLSLFSSFILMEQTGITFNSISLMGFVIALGLLVDNAIVVIENIDRIRDYGLDRKLSAKVAINQVAPAVLAATLTTISAFIPLAMTSGMMGLMLRSLPITILFAISSSFLISLIVTPTIASRALSKFKGREKETRGAVKKWRKIIAVITCGLLAFYAFRIDDAFSIFSYVGAVIFASAMFVKQFMFKNPHGEGQHIAVYAEWLGRVLESRVKQTGIIVIAVLMLIGSFSLVKLGFIKMQLMPNEEPDSMTINIELPQGYLSADTEAITAEVETRLFEMEDIDNFTSSIGGDDTNTATIEVELVDEDLRDVSGYDMIEIIRDAVKGIPGAEITVDAALNMGQRGGGNTMDITISGGTDAAMSELANQYYEIFRRIDGVKDASVSTQGGLPELIIDFDEALAKARGVNIASAASTIRSTVSGVGATDFRLNGEEIDVEIRTIDARLDSVEDFEKIVFRSTSGEDVAFSEVAKVVIKDGVSRIVHDGGQNYITVGGSNTSDSNVSEIIREFQSKVEDIPLPAGVNVSYGGEFKRMNEAFGDMGMNFVIALMLVYILLSIQFNSLTQPIVIIISVPLALIGTLVGLALTGNAIGFYSLFGVVALVGIAVNDAIVLVDYMNYLRAEGHEKHEAIKEAVKTRFNPVLATSITTIGGVLPISVADASLGQLGYALIFGLIASTALTLMIIPIVYSMNDSFTKWISEKFGLFKNETEEALDEA